MKQQREKLGARIRELRVKRGLTQQQVGERCDVSYKYLGNVERGRENPTFDVLVKIAAGLETEPWELLVFDHIDDDTDSLKAVISDITGTADLPTLQTLVRLVRALVR